MAKPSLGVSAPASRFFTPASDQTTVAHIKVTVQFATPKKDGSLQLTVFSGNVAFGISIADLPGRPEYKLGDRLLLEYPKGQNPMTAPYSAIYHADQVSKVSPPQPKKVTTMNEVTPFQFEQSNVRVIVDEHGEPWFVGKDVCEALGYANANQAMATHCKGIQKLDTLQTKGGKQEMRVISEPDLMRLIVNSTLPSAQAFERKVFEEILPTIRKTGSYSMKGSTQSTPIVALPKPTREFKDYYGIAKLIGLDKNAAAIAANQAVIKLTGTDVLQLLEQKQLQADRQDTQWFTPTELGARLSISARAFNLLLAEAGLQMKRGEVWEVTDAGREFARLYDTGKKHGSGVPIQQIKWSPSVTDLLKNDAQKEAA